MKQFFKYVLYREMYSWIREASTDGGTDSSSNRSLRSDDGDSQMSAADLPVDEGAVESVHELQTVLQQMDPYDFEHFVGDIWARMGWDTQVSSASADEGVDVIARKSQPYEQTTLIQAKRYGPNTTVGSPAIQQYASLNQQYDGADEVVIVTTNEYTSQARDLAGRLNVKLINGIDLAKIVARLDAADLVDEYLDFVQTIESDEPTGHTQPHAETAEDPPPETADPEPDTDVDTTSPTTSPEVPHTLWHAAIALAIPGWLLVFFGVNALSTPLWGSVFFMIWFGLPIALFLDARRVREHKDWPRYWWMYSLVSLVPLFAVVPAAVYLWGRRSTGVKTTSSASADSAEPAVAPGNPATAAGHSADSDGETQSQSEPDSSTAAVPPTEPAPDPRADGEVESSPEQAAHRTTVAYGGERYDALTVESADSRYTVAYQDGRFSAGDGESSPGRVFLFQGDDLEFTTEIARPNACAVADNGTVAVVDWNDWGETLSGTLHVFNSSGHRLVKHTFDANIGPVALTSDGEYVATSTFKPDCSTSLFETTSGKRLFHHENQHGNVQRLEFGERNESQLLQLGDSDGDNTYAIDFGGQVVWKCESLRRHDRLDTLLRDSENTDPQESLSLLSEAMDLASESHETRTVAHRMAETHWILAESTGDEDDQTAEQLRHLDRTAEYYRQTLPRYAGKRGLTKVKRQQATLHLANGDETAAHDSLTEIAALEEKYGIQLLTDADERRLNSLQTE